MTRRSLLFVLIALLMAFTAITLPVWAEPSKPKNPFDALEARVQAIEQAVAALTERVAQLEASLNSLSEEVAALVQNPSGVQRKVLTRDFAPSDPGDEVVTDTFELDGCTTIQKTHYLRFSDPAFSMTDPPQVDIYQRQEHDSYSSRPGEYLQGEAFGGRGVMADGTLLLFHKYVWEKQCPDADPEVWDSLGWSPNSDGKVHISVVVVK